MNKDKYTKVKNEMFSKPHPDALSDDHPILMSISMMVQANHE